MCGCMEGGSAAMKMLSRVLDKNYRVLSQFIILRFLSFSLSLE